MRVTTAPIPVTEDLDEVVALLRETSTRGVALRRPKLLEVFDSHRDTITAKLRVPHGGEQLAQSHVLSETHFKSGAMIQDFGSDLGLIMPTDIAEAIYQDTHDTGQILSEVFARVTDSEVEGRAFARLHMMPRNGFGPFAPSWHGDGPPLNAHVSYLFNELEVAALPEGDPETQMHCRAILSEKNVTFYARDDVFDYWKPDPLDIVFMRGIYGNPANQNTPEKSVSFNPDHILFHRSPRDTVETGALTSVYRVTPCQGMF